MMQLLAPGLLGAATSDFMRIYANDIEQGLLKGASEGEIEKSDLLVNALRWRTKAVMCEKSATLLNRCIPAKTEFCLLHACNAVQSDTSVISERHNVQIAARDIKVANVTLIIDAVRKHTSENIVVFSTRNELLKQMQKERYGHLYTGEMSIERRDKVLVDFPTRPGDVLYMATRAGGVGLNLTRASRVVIADISWNPVDDIQAVARCYRMGQTLPVTVYRLVADLTLEKGIYLLGIKKQRVASRIMEEQDVPRHFSKQDLAELSGPESKADDDELDAKDIDDAPTRELAQSCTLIDHDKRAAVATSCTISFVDKNEAASNIYNQISHQSVRLITRESGLVEAIQP